MSKSLRSKQKRANRIVKRQKNSKKELVKLQKVVEQAKESSQSQESKKIYTVLGPITDEAATDKVAETEMAVDGAEPAPPTEDALRTVAIEEMPMNTAPKKSTGDYPAWMNQRAIKRAKKAEKKKNSKIRKSRTAGRRPWRGH